MFYAGLLLLLLGLLALAGARSHPTRLVTPPRERDEPMSYDEIVFTRGEIDRLGFLAWRVERHELDDDIGVVVPQPRPTFPIVRHLVEGT